MNDVVRVEESDLLHRKIRERNWLRIDNIAVAIFAECRGTPVGADMEFPDLEFLGGNLAVMLLGDGNDVEQPVCTCLFSDLLSTVGEHY
jgi:hypothetical protein